MKALDEIPEAWRLAMQREKDAGEFYARMAQSADDEAIRSLFQMLETQEKEHYALLEGEYRRLFEPDLELGKERLPLPETSLEQLHKEQDAARKELAGLRARIGALRPQYERLLRRLISDSTFRKRATAESGPVDMKDSF